MATLTITLDERAFAGLRRISDQAGDTPEQTAARLLTRAARLARPRAEYDEAELEDIKRRYAEFAEEDLALAESGLEERARLLAEEDAA